MKILVTGAAGFLGQHVVTEALAKGHSVRAMIRPVTNTSLLPFDGHENLEYSKVDLRARRDIPQAVQGIDLVIHLAAAPAGDFYAQFEGTVVATENLLETLKSQAGIPIVLISSFAVYDYLRKWSFTTLDENSALESNIENRDEYTYTKLAQERLVRAYAEKEGWQLVVLRPGVIYGPGKLLSARMGLSMGNRWWMRIGRFAQVPLTYVENCAQAIVLAAETDEAAGQTYNIVDDHPPSQAYILRRLQKRPDTRRRILRVPWTFMRCLARAAWLFNRICLGGKAKLPGLLVPAGLHARFKPLKYSNRLIRDSLNWNPRYTLEEALDRCTAALGRGSATDSAGLVEPDRVEMKPDES